jgi:KDO2-lipid IV(A) lauroyltransferase
VVRSNIKGSFPEKSEKELLRIEKAFYRHLCDLFVESIKLFTISEKEMRKRLTVSNAEVINRFKDENRSVIVVMGHYNNWEFIGKGLPFISNLIPKGIYKKINNPVFEKAMYKSRSAFGTRGYEMRESKRMFEELSNEPSMLVFVSDQSPSNLKNVVWLNFLNRETAVMTGAERYAMMYNLPVVFLDLQKVKRGYYQAHYTILFENPKDCKPEEITRCHVAFLEEIIRKKPEFWLWSHKRWKHQRTTA